jgi:hypothetical protein
MKLIRRLSCEFIKAAVTAAKDYPISSIRKPLFSNLPRNWDYILPHTCGSFIVTDFEGNAASASDIAIRWS